MAKPKITELEDELISSLTPGLEYSLSAFMDQMMQDYERSLVFVPPETTASIAIVDALSSLWLSGSSAGIDAFKAMNQKSDLSLRTLLKYSSRYGASKTKQIVSTSISQVRDIILAGQRRGLTPTEITREVITRIPELAKMRAKIIATTEVHAAAQFGLIEAARNSQRVLTKRWITVEDDRVRDFARNAEFSHTMTHGQTAALENSFRIPRSNGSFEPLDFPGDPAGSAGNIINCRCTMEFGSD